MKKIVHALIMPLRKEEEKKGNVKESKKINLES